MNNKWTAALVLAGALLAGCGEEKEQAAHSTADGEAGRAEQETHSAGTSDESAAVRAPIEEAEGIPGEEKKAILAVLNEQIQSFNNKDLARYMATISETPKSFDYDEEKAYVEKVFQTFDAVMEPENITIIQYDKSAQTANVFMNMKSTSKDIATGKQVQQTTRQIMVFQKEESGWKQVSLFAME
ncbi:nuclear transport factor 2 family protein [Domibacillus robiginosus]|uniref:nuclear transport factor 2 family protein n=1 Tax=Domibacillus robiginosus TaxID=1071054 RepID=UPI00067AEFD3|nr:nuclear transport factor 2 family protein [Domibacillus robiginosus]